LLEDQADRLRRLKQAERNHQTGRQKRGGSGALRIAVTSGKGGVGKSNFALNCAVALALMRQKVLLIDADTNLANLDILIGMNTRFNLSDVIAGEKFMREIIMPGPGGIDILPGSSGVLEMLELDLQVQRRLVETFSELEQEYNFILIDTGAGLTPSILSYVSAADEVALITNQEPTSIADAYAMIKVVTHRNPTLPIRLMVNLAPSQEAALDVYDRINLVAQNYLNLPVEFLGYMPRDPNVPAAVARQAPFVLAYPRTPASVAIRMMARQLLHRKGGEGGSLLERMVK
jgi:flagellar biosynthesis protein FlhG